MELPRDTLTVDIETSPCIGYFWRPGHKISVPAENVIEPSRIICVGYKWSHEKQVRMLDWGDAQDDKPILEELNPVFDQAVLLVGQNHQRFDLRWIAARNAYHNLPPIDLTTPTADTLVLSRKHFEMPSHKLDFMAQYFGLGGKMEHEGFKLWTKVMAGDPHALVKMKRYCRRDVALTEQYLIRILPYVSLMKTSISMLTGAGREACPQCGAKHVIKHGKFVSRAGSYQKWQCKECAHVWKDNRMLKDKLQ